MFEVEKIQRVGAVDTALRMEEWGARFTVVGELKSEDVGPVLGLAVAQLSAWRVPAAVCDYRAADVCVAARSILQAHRQAGVRHDWPTALVVNPLHVEVWSDYARLQLQRGNMRGVFTCVEEARKWAAHQAALREIHTRWLGRAR